MWARKRRVNSAVGMVDVVQGQGRIVGRGLGIDDPGLAGEGGEQLLPGGIGGQGRGAAAVGQFAALAQRVQALQEAIAKRVAKRVLPKEPLAAAGDPRLRGFTPHAAGHDAVQMEGPLQPLGPGVQDRQEAKLAFEPPLRIVCKVLENPVGRAE